MTEAEHDLRKEFNIKFLALREEFEVLEEQVEHLEAKFNYLYKVILKHQELFRNLLENLKEEKLKVDE